MNTIERNQDVITGLEDLEHLYTLKNFPVFMGCVTQSQNEDLVHDINFYIGRSSGMIQINPVLPLDIVYQTEHNPGTTGQGWLDHHRAFSDFILQFEPKQIFEIGGAHGILSQYATEYNSSLSWTILEPNPVPMEGLRATMQTGFFNSVDQIPNGTDTVVHSHVLEHVYEPRKFMETLSTLPSGTKMIFSVPALRAHMNQQFTNTLNFEHTYFCTEEFIEWLCGCYGFDLLDRYYYKDDHSIFYAVIRNSDDVKFWSHPDQYQENSVLFTTWLEYHQRLIRNFNEKISASTGSVYLFGAHVFSQYLLSFGLDRSKIECILDNSTAKQGKRLYGTDLTVQSPHILKDLVNPVIVLRTGVFNTEIKQDILTNINPTAVFLE